MFSGIIEKVASVLSSEVGGEGMRLVLDTGFSGLELGESIAVNGALRLTVVPL